MFHWRDNLFFERLDKGAVHIVKLKEEAMRRPHRPYEQTQYRKEDVIFEATIPDMEWASIIASVSAFGESDGGWDRALSFHHKEDPC